MGMSVPSWVHGTCPIHAPFHPGISFAMRHHAMVGIEFSHVCLAGMCIDITMAYNFHCHRFSCAAMPRWGCTAPVHQTAPLSFWSFGRISMEIRPRCRAALVRALPVFVCRRASRRLFFCGSGKFPKRPGAPDGRCARWHQGPLLPN